jgi:hypothetical protein
VSESASTDRWWVGVAGAVRGVSNSTSDQVEVAASEWPSFAVAGQVLGVLGDDELRLHDAITGASRSTVRAPGAAAIFSDGAGFWLDHGHVARRLSFDGVEQALVPLDGGLGLIAVSPRFVATRVPGPYDYGTVRVLSTSGSRMFETPRLTNCAAAAFTAAGIVVASDEGVNHWSIGEAPTPTSAGLRDVDVSVTPRSQALNVVATSNGWCELWLDVQSSTSRPIGPPVGHPDRKFRRVEATTIARSRIARVVLGATVASRSFDERVLGLAVSPSRMHVLLCGRPAGDLGAAEDVHCFIGDDALEPVGAVRGIGDDWRQGFAVAGRRA